MFEEESLTESKNIIRYDFEISEKDIGQYMIINL